MSTRHALTAITAAALFLAAWCAAPRALPTAAESAGARETIDRLKSVRLDPAEVYFLRDVRIYRGGVNLYFNRGFVGFFTKVNGEETGAAFTGDGEILLIPPSAPEKRSLARFTGSPILEERFTSAYLRFNDRTAEELRSAAKPPESVEAEKPEGFVEYWNTLSEKVNEQYSLRLAQDLVGDRSAPFFQAQLRGVEHQLIEVTDDERMPEAVRVAGLGSGERAAAFDIWCSYPSHPAAERPAQESIWGAARVESYKIDSRINPDNSLDGRAELMLESQSDADRILVFELSSHLKLSEVTDGEGHRLDFLQSEAEVAGKTRLAGRGVAVLMPAPYPSGSKYRLTFVYHGNLISKVGNGVLYVGERDSWYPNRGLDWHSRYDLAFHCPEQLVLVATGRRAEERVADGWRNSRWVSDGPFPVAGFNLGAYESRVRQADKVAIEVYANRGAEASLERRRRDVVVVPRPDLRPSRTQPAPSEMTVTVAPPLTPAALLDQVAESAAGTVEHFENLFGPFPYSRVGISQIPGSFGQGWPELVYLPTFTFLPSPERAELGLEGKSTRLENQVFLFHELAHQWWGNEVGWASYHDQWLSEGFATYAAALHLAREKDGEKKFRELMKQYRADLLARDKEGKTVESAGPIWLGERLSNSLDPEGFDAIVYKKACWVIHMLRTLMTDPATGSDTQFFKMLRDFVAAYRGETPSTEDFIRHAEKYMTRALDLEGKGRLHWFFNAWVMGTGIPGYSLRVSTRKLSSGKYVVEGAIEQSGVPDEFEMAVPVVASAGAGRKSVLGFVHVEGSGGRFRFVTARRPAKVSIDEDNLLAVVR